MPTLLGLSGPLVFLFVLIWALFACVIGLFIVYVVRLVARRRAGSSAPIRAGRMNMVLFTVISVILGTGYISFWGAGMFTNNSMLSGIGYIFLDLFLIYVLVMALRWVR